jgi:hypothetical protein
MIGVVLVLIVEAREISMFERVLSWIGGRRLIGGVESVVIELGVGMRIGGEVFLMIS